MKVLCGVVIIVFIWLSALQLIIVCPGVQNGLFGVVSKTHSPQLDHQRTELLLYLATGAEFDRSDYSESELSHIEDLRFLISSIRLTYQVLLLVLVVFIVVYRKKWSGCWSALIKKSSLFGALILVVLGGSSLVFFEYVFVRLHQVLFPQGNWTFDPLTDLIIQIYPPNFFIYFGTLWFAIAFVLHIAIWIWALLFDSRQQRHQDQQH